MRNVGCEIKSPRFKLVVLILGCMLRDYDLISLQFSLSIVVFSRALQVFLSVWPRLRITTVFSFVCFGCGISDQGLNLPALLRSILSHLFVWSEVEPGVMLSPVNVQHPQHHLFKRPSSPHCVLSTCIENQLTTDIKVYFCALNSIPLT